MVSALAIVVWALLDVIVSTVTSYQSGLMSSSTVTTFSNTTVTSFAINVHITSTTLDLCFLGWLRATVTLMWTLSMSRCSRITNLTAEVLYHTSLMTTLLMWMYSGVKLLLFAEDDDVISDRSRQTTLGWTCCACIVNLCLLPWSRQNCATFKQKHSGKSEEEIALLGEKDFTKEGAPNLEWRISVYRLFRVSIPDLHFITCGICFLLGGVTCELLVPRYTGRVVDSLVVDPSQEAFHDAIVRLVVVAVGLTICTWMQKLLFAFYVARVTARLRRMLFASVMSQDVDFFDQYETGDLVTTLLTDVAIMGDCLSPNLDQCAKGFFGVVGVVVCMANTSWQLSLLSTISLPIFAANSYGYGIMMKAVGRSSQAIMADMGDQADENFSNIRTVRSFAMEKREAEIFEDSVWRLFRIGKKEAIAHSTFQPLALLIQISLQVCALLYGGHLVQRSFLSGGDLVTFVIFLSMINTCVQVVNATYGGVAKGIGASHVVFKHLTRKPKYTGKGTLVKNHFRGEIEFKDVCFSYPIRPHHSVINNLSFHVSPGEVVALVGPSGGGKSTCVSLLLSFYQPVSGHVLLDGVPVNLYDHSYLHSKVALVGQEPVLFSRSIRDNITYGLIDLWSEDDVISAAKLANAHDFICALPSAYDTNAGAKGLQISGGQKQRVAIARALVRQPVVLLLDEATSALDSHSEAKVQDALNSCMDGRTVIIIAHRLSTVEKADRVLVIHKGHVVEEGTPSDLINMGGMFASLAKHQLKSADNTSESIGQIDLFEDCREFSCIADRFDNDDDSNDDCGTEDTLNGVSVGC